MDREEYLRTHTRPTPEKYCAFCGKKMERVRFDSGRLEDSGAFMRRKYCCRNCMRKAYVKKGENTKQRYRCAHSSAEKLAYLIMGREKKCELCGSTHNIDVHHKDGNYLNNTPENIEILCRGCHMKTHRKPKAVCKVCGKPIESRGFCGKHYQRFMKYGDPLISWGRRVEE